MRYSNSAREDTQVMIKSRRLDTDVESALRHYSCCIISGLRVVTDFREDTQVVIKSRELNMLTQRATVYMPLIPMRAQLIKWNMLTEFVRH